MLPFYFLLPQKDIFHNQGGIGMLIGTSLHTEAKVTDFFTTSQIAPLLSILIFLLRYLWQLFVDLWIFLKKKGRKNLNKYSFLQYHFKETRSVSCVKLA